MMKALKCKTLSAEVTMHTHCISAVYVDDQLPTSDIQGMVWGEREQAVIIHYDEQYLSHRNAM